MAYKNPDSHVANRGSFFALVDWVDPAFWGFDIAELDASEFVVDLFGQFTSLAIAEGMHIVTVCDAGNWGDDSGSPAGASFGEFV